jgi:hypothetical protein
MLPTPTVREDPRSGSPTTAQAGSYSPAGRLSNGPFGPDCGGRTAGLLIFVFSVGYQFTARRSSNSVAGWPLALLLIGAGALVLGFFASRFARSRAASSS